MPSARTSPSRSRDALETSLCRRGVVSTSASNAQLELPLDGRDLLGLLRTSGRITMFDYEVLAWITERWLATGPPADGPLDRDQEWVSFTYYEVGFDLYGREPGGKERRLLRTAFRRLTTLELDVIGYDARRDEFRNVAGVGRLLRNIQSEYDDLGPAPEPGAVGALRGSTFEARLDDWMLASLRRGNITYLRSATLRRLSGLAKRLWILLEAQPVNREEELPLGDELYTTLGMNYAVERQGRAALRRAAAQIAGLDPRYNELAVREHGNVWTIGTGHAGLFT